MEKQLTLNFDPSIVDEFEWCREFIDDHSRKLGKQRKWLAAEMDYSPSQLSRKFAQVEGDSARLTLDDAEVYTQKTNDTAWIVYLVAKYIGNEQTELEKLRQQVEELTKQKAI